MESLGKMTIKRPGMNPWKKELKRMVFRHDERFFIYGSHCCYPEEIAGRTYTEVVEVKGYWYIK